jgi:hypothetical protein
MNALISAVNDLPGDDPLRQAVTASRTAESTATVVKVNAKADAAKAKEAAAAPATNPAPETASVAIPQANPNAVKVPSFIGMAVRQVVEQAPVAGLTLRVEGRGLVRTQTPVAGSLVQPGTQVIVHCAR